MTSSDVKVLIPILMLQLQLNRVNKEEEWTRLEGRWIQDQSMRMGLQTVEDLQPPHPKDLMFEDENAMLKRNQLTIERRIATPWARTMILGHHRHQIQETTKARTSRTTKLQGSPEMQQGARLILRGCSRNSQPLRFVGT